MEALTLAVDTARRLSSHAIDAAVAAAQLTEEPRFTNWRAAGLWGGFAGLAVLAASLDAVEPGCGWDSVGFDYLRRAVRGMEAEQSPSVGLTGLTGLATAASLLSSDGNRYGTLLTTLETAIVERVEHASEGVLRSRPHGVPVALFDVITGLAGAGRYLLSRAQSAPCRRALETLLRALVYLSEDGAGAVPHWHTTFRQSTDTLRRLYPYGNINFGLAHGIPGPLALLSLSASHGVEVTGQHAAIVRTADLIVQAQAQRLPPAQQGLRAQQIRQATLDANARIGEMEGEEKRLLDSRRGADDRWAAGLIATFVVLLLTVTAVLTWLCLRVRTEMRARTRQAAALGRANSSLETANRELESFSYSVSHDLRSPLRAIDGYSLMLQEDYSEQLDETGRRYIQTIRNGSQRMGALIDDLLTFSRLSRQSLNRQTVDMTTLARRAAAEVLEGQPNPKPAVNIPDLPAVSGDPALLRQVWTNLISNAVKYSSKSATPEVHVRAAAEGRLVRFEVQDNGVGFDMRYADKLFGVFQRLHSIDEYPGTGVGLAIVQRIIARHEGAVSARGERGKGATFGFTLPTQV